MGVRARLLDSGVERAIESLQGKVQAPVRLRLWDGRAFDFGPEPTVTITLREAAAARYFVKPTLATLGEAFVEGHVDVDGPMPDIVRAAEGLSSSGGRSVWERLKIVRHRHTRRVDAESISYHYDVSNEFYRLWLDREMVYSCAYFPTGAEDLDTAQARKLDHICRKLMLKPGERMLDIGCGWGALVMWAAKHYQVDATGITLSKNQHALANERIRELGLGERCRVLLQDYRDVPGEGVFDKIASIGMFEHVGLNNLPVYFATVRRLLRERGLFLNHGITSADPESREVGLGAGEFVGRYVFPNGELPHLSLVVHDMSAQQLEVHDVECLRPHYARTLGQWSARLEGRLDAARALVPERTLRIWRVYLAGCAFGFDQGWMSIYQILASRQTRPGPTALPLSREFMYPR